MRRGERRNDRSEYSHLIHGAQIVPVKHCVSTNVPLGVPKAHLPIVATAVGGGGTMTAVLTGGTA